MNILTLDALGDDHAALRMGQGYELLDHRQIGRMPRALHQPDVELEKRIVRLHIPEIDATLNAQLVAFVQKIRELDIKKNPSVSETIDWARTLVLLQRDKLTPEIVQETMHILLKFETDIDTVRGQVATILRQIKAEPNG